MSSLIAVGIGNTSVKFGSADSPSNCSDPCWSWWGEESTNRFDPASLSRWLSEAACRWRVASVHRPSEQILRQWLQASRPHDDYRCLTHADVPLGIDVRFPERVGMDRLMAALAVNTLRERYLPAIVIDAGTAITVDLVDAEGVFRGGAILAGRGLTARALASGTDLLPDVDCRFHGDPPAAIGRSTEEAIRSGLFWGSLGAIRELVRRIEGQLATSPQIFATGGDAEQLVKHLPEGVHFIPDLVLRGIALAADAEAR